MRQTASEILNELRCAVGITLAYEPRADQFGVGVDGNPSPDIARDSLLCHLVGHVLLLRVYETPDLIDLNAAAIEVH